jgi:hypothetical protein
MKYEIGQRLVALFMTMSMDKPENFEQIVDFVYEDVKKCADKDWSDGDVVIGFRRFIESKNN